jgi:hypothetical protein
MADFTWLSGLFSAADALQQQLVGDQFVSINVSVVTNELGGAIVGGGTVTFAQGSLVYLPARTTQVTVGTQQYFHSYPPSFSSTSTSWSTYFQSLFRQDVSDKVIGKIALQIVGPNSGSPPQIVVTFLDAQGAPAGTTTLSSVGSNAHVLYGAGNDGLATPPDPSGPTALYVIAPFNPQIQKH